MNDFAPILNWKLLAGSHDFPGPDGGTCINEAAIIAAGFKYRRVKSWKDCPPCFSPTISAFAIVINDRMPHAVRNELLLPFVTRMAGTMHGLDLELKRMRLFISWSRKYRAAAAAYAAAYAAAAYAADAAAAAAAYAAAAANAADAAYAAAIWQSAINILNEAINLGPPQPLDLQIVIPRLEKAKAFANT